MYKAKGNVKWRGRLYAHGAIIEGDAAELVKLGLAERVSDAAEGEAGALPPASDRPQDEPPAKGKKGKGKK